MNYLEIRMVFGTWRRSYQRIERTTQLTLREKENKAPNSRRDGGFVFIVYLGENSHLANQARAASAFPFRVSTSHLQDSSQKHVGQPREQIEKALQGECLLRESRPFLQVDLS